MVNKKLSDTVTAADADWSFLEIPGVLKGLTTAAEGVAASSDYSVEQDDMFQEAAMALAVRPKLVKSALADGSGIKLLIFRGQQFMLKRAEVEAKRGRHDDYPDADGWWDGNEN